MRWEWDDDGDTRVSDLWHLRTELSRCRDVVYANGIRVARRFLRVMFHRMLAALIYHLVFTGAANS